MTAGPRPSRRGTALLLVLGAMMIVLTASVTVARQAAHLRMQRRLDAQTATADEMLGSVDAAIRSWLSTSSGEVILPPEAEVPAVTVLHDAWDVEGTSMRVSVTAWDQAGMVPLSAARSGSPVRLVLPAETRRVVDRLGRLVPDRFGLDVLRPHVREGDGIDLYPALLHEPYRSFGQDVVPPDAPPALIEPPPRPAVGALLATHHPGAINVNTAPLDLVRSVMRAQGRGGIELIEAARAAGETFTPPAAPPGGNRPRAGVPTLGGTSRSWAFRLDIHVGSVHRAWWANYVRAPREWECVQRLVIDE